MATDQADEDILALDLRDISPDGDVMLVVGSQGIELRVSSHCLRAASSVFNIMFGPHWKEGQNLCSSRPTEVRLVEDDADMMQLICCVIHHRNDDIPHTIDGRTALRLAVVIDKYDCARAMQHFIQWYMRPDGEAMDTLSEQAYLTAAAYILKNDELFHHLTRGLVVEFKPFYLPLVKDPLLRQHLPCELFCLVADKSARARAQLVEIVYDQKDNSCNCAVRPLRLAIYDSLAKQWAQSGSSLTAISIRDMINNLRPLSKGSGCLEGCDQFEYYTYFHGGDAPEIEAETLKNAAISLSELQRITATGI